jgi:hypothetical protein
MAYEWAVPGAKCVCVRCAWTPCAFHGPQVGDILTIREVVVTRAANGGVALSFDEQSTRDYFTVVAFRPLVTRTQEQDVALFAPFLHGQPAEVE